MNRYKSVTAFAPASVANVGCGFDVMGYAVDGIGDKVTITYNPDADTTKVILKGKYGHLTPETRHKNTAGVAVIAYLQALGMTDMPVEIELEKNMPLGSGMGSSASSSAAAVFAINELLGCPLSTLQLIPFAMEGERIACGTAHADNVAPALLGGFTLIRSYNPLDIVPVNCPEDLFSAIIHPDIELNTADARRVLKSEVSFQNAISQSANTAGFMVALIRGDYDLLKRSMSDLLAEPYRTQLIPGFDAVKNAAMDAGAVGCGISGSGPSVFALCQGQHKARQVADAISTEFHKIGLHNEAFVSKVDAPGTRVTGFVAI